VVKARIYMVSLLDLLVIFYRRATFEMSALEQCAEKWTFSAAWSSDSDRSDAPPPWLRAWADDIHI